MAGWTRIADSREALRRISSPQMRAFYSEYPPKRFTRMTGAGGLYAFITTLAGDNITTLAGEPLRTLRLPLK